MIKVLKAGFSASIQDSGRVGFAQIGVPLSGAMDTYSMNIANSILNNSLQDAVLEVTFGGVQLAFLSNTFICISGGDFSPKINEKPVLMNSRIEVFIGDVLSFGKINFGVRCYLAVKMGFQTDIVLGSRSFYNNITNTSVIQKNDGFKIKNVGNHYESSYTSLKVLKSHFESKEITCYKGPEFDLLNEYQKEQIFEQLFTISNDNNRMGYRLKEVVKNDFPSILTSSILPGTVQLTPSGKIIVLMRDCQVTGGYPRILQLSEKAINQLSQKSTNDKFQFVLESL